MRILAASIVVGSLLAGGVGQRLFAQSTDSPSADDAKLAPPVVKPDEKATKSAATFGLSTKEISKRAAGYSRDMQTMLERILQLQAQARTDKDIIKLDCVNEILVTAKQVLALADKASISLTEAISANDTVEQEHQLDQLKIAQERISGEKDAAEVCLGEEIVFVGPNSVTVSGLGVKDNPTDDTDLVSDNHLNSSEFTSVEPVVYASPIAPL